MTEISSVHKDMKCRLYYRVRDRESFRVVPFSSLTCYQDPGFHLSTLIKSVLAYLSKDSLRGLKQAEHFQASWSDMAESEVRK